MAQRRCCDRCGKATMMRVQCVINVAEDKLDETGKIAEGSWNYAADLCDDHYQALKAKIAKACNPPVRRKKRMKQAELPFTPTDSVAEEKPAAF